MIRKAVVVVVILAIGAGGYYWMGSPLGSGETEQRRGNAAFQMRSGITGSRWGRDNPDANALQVEAIDTRLEPHAPAVPLLATVAAKRRETLTAPVAARVANIRVSAGETVSAGQPLLELSADSLQWSLRQQEVAITEQEAAIRIAEHQHQANLAELEQARSNYEREMRLREQGYADADSVQTAADTLRAAELAVAVFEDESIQRQAQLDSAQIALDQARSDVDDLTPTAPFDAEVVSIDTAESMRVSADQTLMTLVDRSSLYARTQVPLSIYRRIRGQQIEAEARLGDRTYPLRVTSLAASAEAGSVALEVTLPPELPALINETIELHLALPPVETFAVPQDAIYQGNRLYLIEEGALAARTINVTGHQQRQGEQWALVTLDGEQAVDELTVLTTRLSQPTSGTPVNRVDPDSAASSDDLQVGDAR